MICFFTSVLWIIFAIKKKGNMGVNMQTMWFFGRQHILLHCWEARCMYQNQACQNTRLHSIRNENRLIRKFSRPVPICPMYLAFRISYLLEGERDLNCKMKCHECRSKYEFRIRVGSV